MSNGAWDIIIVGGGLAGLSLAVELSEPQFAHLKVLVLEQRNQYTRDRTWSYWATAAHRYSSLERRRWSKWTTRFEGRVAVQTSKRAYCTLDADAFYAHAMECISASKHVRLRLGTQVHHIVNGAPAQVHLPDGGMLQAQWVMDARPEVIHVVPNDVTHKATHGTGCMAQHFEGWEIEADRDCFDPETLDLMDFQPAQHGLHFFYVLPYTARRALVETTWISRWTAGKDYGTELEQYLQARWPGMRYKKVYAERGVLGLESPPARSNHRVVPLGRNAGTLRLSTGFAFLNTLADAKRIADWIGKTPLSQPGNTIASFKPFWLDVRMDQFFMAAMKADWPRAPNLFMSMFAKVDPLTLTDFLAGSSSITQRAKIAMSLPKLHFLRVALQLILKPLRSVKLLKSAMSAKPAKTAQTAQTGQTAEAHLR